jgi:hypothetical protein
MAQPTAMPIVLARAVQARKDLDIRAELVTLLEQGLRRITVGIGPGVDLPLLDEELYQAEIALLDREVVIAVVRAEPDGYVIERGYTNFGLYTWSEIDPIWISVPYGGTSRGLRPGDKVAMGSAPADALQFELPESALVPPRVHRRSARLDQAEAKQRKKVLSATTVPIGKTPAPAPPRDPWEGVTPRPVGSRSTPSMGTPWGSPFARRPMPLRVDSDRYQARFDVAIKHWRYSMITIGGDERSVIPIDDPEFATFRVALARNLEQPERGYELFVKDPGPEVWVQPLGESPRILDRGSVIRLRGPGNRMGFAGYLLHIPEPAAPVPRFGPRHDFSNAEIADVLGMREYDLEDHDQVKAVWKHLVQRFHPDKHDGEPGHLSRFLEIQACYDAWKRRTE